MKEYLISVIMTAVSVAISELILPQGRLKTVINTVFSLAMLVVIISPLKTFNESQSEFVFKAESQEKFTVDTSFINEYFDGKAEKLYANQFKSKLLDNDLVAEEVIVEISNMEIIKIKIFLSNLVIPEENSHINNNVIAKYVAEALGVEAEKVEIYA